jgi:hypothetical protein
MYSCDSSPDIKHHPLSIGREVGSRTMYPTGLPSTVIMSVAMHPPNPTAIGFISLALSAYVFFMMGA